jgi:hypothetical protein
MTRFRRWLVALIVLALLLIGAFSFWQLNANRTMKALTVQSF